MSDPTIDLVDSMDFRIGWAAGVAAERQRIMEALTAKGYILPSLTGQYGGGDHFRDLVMGENRDAGSTAS